VRRVAWTTAGIRAADASRPVALLVSRIRPVFSLLAPGRTGAPTPSALAGLYEIVLDAEAPTCGLDVDSLDRDALASTSRPGYDLNPPSLNGEHSSQEYFERVVRGAINRRGR